MLDIVGQLVGFVFQMLLELFVQFVLEFLWQWIVQVIVDGYSNQAPLSRRVRPVL